MLKTKSALSFREKWRDEARSALAVAAAVAGVGYASGREQVLFFAQLGWAAWIAIPLASIIFGLLVGAVCHWARRSGAGSMASVFRRKLGRVAGAVAGAMHALLMALTAMVMLAGAGEIGALTLPLRHGFLWGAALALMIALTANLSRQRALPWLGLLAAVIGVAFYAGLAIDPRPVRVYMRGETTLSLRGNPVAAILLASLYASLNASLAGGVVVRFSSGRMDPARFAVLCGSIMGALLLCANAAIVRGGDQLLSQAAPTVVLAARWGSFGFWLSAGFCFLCAASTLAAALGELLSQAEERGRIGAALMLGLAALLCVLLGISAQVGKGYALMGWLCAFSMAALACRFDRERVCGRR